MKDALPCLDLLEATPGILRGLMSEISDEDARWKPAADRFSIAEVLSHLSHSEGHCYRAQMLHEWALHDIGHIRQIAELVRARRYLAGAGPLGADYQLKP
jgi:hypothetical protein